MTDCRIEILPDLVVVFETPQFEVSREHCHGYVMALVDGEQTIANRFKVITKFTPEQLQLIRLNDFIGKVAEEIQLRTYLAIPYDYVVLMDCHGLGKGIFEYTPRGYERIDG